MDAIIKYPLYRAHKNQIEAEEKELKGDFSSAIKLRMSTLDNLNAALKLTHQESVIRTLQLQINHEEVNLERLILHDKETKKLLKSLKSTIKEVQAESSKKEANVDLLDNAETMEGLLSEMEMKLQNINEDCSSITQFGRPMDESSMTDEFDTIKQDKVLENLPTQLQDVLSLTQAAKECHFKNVRFTRMILNSYFAMKTDFEALQGMVNDMKDRGRPKLKVIDASEGASSGINISLTASTPASIMELVPLDNPQLDFLSTGKFSHF